MKSSRVALGIMRGLTGNNFTRVYSHFWGLAQNECIGCCYACFQCSGAKMQSVKSPKQVCFDLRVQLSKQGSLYYELGVELSCLMLGEVEIRGSTQLDGKPLPQCKPSASRCDATSEEKLKL